MMTMMAPSLTETSSWMVLVPLVMMLAPPLAETCSASHRHPHFQRRNPALFTFSKNITKTEELCAIQLRGAYESLKCKYKMSTKSFSGRDSLSCQAVDVNPDAFLAKSLTIPITPDNTLTNSVLDPTDGEGVEEVQLVKRLQLGLDLALHDRSSPATAQIQYSSSSGRTRERDLRNQGWERVWWFD